MKAKCTIHQLAPVLVILTGVLVNNPSAIAAVSVGSSPWVWQNPLPQGFTLNAISCFDTNHCIAVGDGGVILATANGGTTWIGEPSPVTPLSLRAVHCANDTNCAVTGDHGIILTTTNGGASWSFRISGTAADLTGVTCDLADPGAFAVGPGQGY